MPRKKSTKRGASVNVSVDPALFEELKGVRDSLHLSGLSGVVLSILDLHRGSMRGDIVDHWVEIDEEEAVAEVDMTGLSGGGVDTAHLEDKRRPIPDAVRQQMDHLDSLRDGPVGGDQAVVDMGSGDEPLETPIAMRTAVDGKPPNPIT